MKTQFDTLGIGKFIRFFNSNIDRFLLIFKALKAEEFNSPFLVNDP